jgi:hypothetical protein
VGRIHHKGRARGRDRTGRRAGDRVDGSDADADADQQPDTVQHAVGEPDTDAERHAYADSDRLITLK